MNKIIRLKDCCSFQEGYVNPSQKNSEYFGGDIKWLRASDLTGSFVYNTERTLSKKGFKSAGASALLFKKDTIAISKSGTIGVLGILKDEMCGNRAVINIEVNKSIANLYYIFYLLRYKHKELISKAHGSIQKNLYISALETITLNHSDLYSQQKIAAVLSSLDAKIELNNRINAELEAMAKTLYDYWFVQFDFLDVNGKPYKSSGGRMEWNKELNREIPEGWGVKPLAELTSLLVRGISPKYADDNGIIVLNQKCIRNKIINFSLGRRHDHVAKSAISKLIKIGDVLINSTGVGTLGRVAMVKRLEEPLVTVDSHVTIVRIDKNKANQLFIGYSLTEKQDEIEQLGEGSTGQTELSRDNLGKLKLLLPPDGLQTVFDNFLKPQIQKIANNEKENQQLTELRDWLLPMLMNGQVTVAEAKESIAMAAEPEVGYGR